MIQDKYIEGATKIPRKQACFQGVLGQNGQKLDLEGINFLPFPFSVPCRSQNGSKIAIIVCTLELFPFFFLYAD